MARRTPRLSLVLWPACFSETDARRVAATRILGGSCEPARGRFTLPRPMECERARGPRRPRPGAGHCPRATAGSRSPGRVDRERGQAVLRGQARRPRHRAQRRQPQGPGVHRRGLPVVRREAGPRRRAARPPVRQRAQSRGEKHGSARGHRSAGRARPLPRTRLRRRSQTGPRAQRAQQLPCVADPRDGDGRDARCPRRRRSSSSRCRVRSSRRPTPPTASATPTPRARHDAAGHRRSPPGRPAPSQVDRATVRVHLHGGGLDVRVPPRRRGLRRLRLAARAAPACPAARTTFAVRAVDAAGNPDPSPATRDWTVEEPDPPGGGPTDPPADDPAAAAPAVDRPTTTSFADVHAASSTRGADPIQKGVAAGRDRRRPRRRPARPRAATAWAAPIGGVRVTRARPPRARPHRDARRRRLRPGRQRRRPARRCAIERAGYIPVAAAGRRRRGRTTPPSTTS